MTIKCLALLVFVLALASAISGCGGSDAPALATSSMSKAEFAKQAEAICARGRREALAYRPADKGESERDALTAAIDQGLLPSFDKAIDDLYALGAPAAEKQQVEALLTAMREAVEKAEGLDPPRVERIEDIFARSGELAHSMGLVSCVYSG
jgi:hypothetical protein